MYDDFWLMYTSDPRSKPSPKSSSCWSPWIIEKGAEIWSETLQNAINVIYSLLTPDVKRWLLLGPLSVIMVSELFTGVPISLKF